ncbi:acetyl-CoA carboxylase biotin carboxylase subunit family protein [Jeotgalibaca porci]|uniref:ATP-grasp domain-containing protein n=1 Tax=Jeotgalibaca porci TaxID=1868793 RepID=UPI00359F2120
MKTSIFLLLSLNNFLDILKIETSKVDKVHILTPLDNLEYTEEELSKFLGVHNKIIISRNVTIKKLNSMLNTIDSNSNIENVFAFEEYCLLGAAVLREYFKINGKYPKEILPFRDKKIMIKLLEKSDIQSVKIPYTEEYVDYKQVSNLLKEYNKVIAKRRDGMGSKDMVIFTNDLTISQIKELASRIRKDKKYLVQEFIEGSVFHYDTYIIDRTPIIDNIMMYQDHQFEFDSNDSLSAVSVADDDLRSRLINSAHDIIRSYGFDKVTLHLEMIHSDAGIYFCEVGVRPGGAGVVPVVQELYGINLFEVEYSLQSNEIHRLPNRTIEQVNYGGWTIIHPTEGYVTYVSDVNEILSVEGVKSAKSFIAVGDYLSAGKHCATKVFQAVYTSEDIETVSSSKDKILSNFKFKTKN